MNSPGLGIVCGIVFALLFAIPSPTYAMSATFFGPIVPMECHCDNQPNPLGGTISTAPDYGCVLQVIENVINFAVTLSAILFTIYLVITGFAFITSGGSSEARSKAKTRFVNVFVGLAVLLCSWLLVDYVMKTIYDQGKFGPWNAILAGSPSGVDRCIIAHKPVALSVGQVAFTVPAGTSATGGAGGSSISVSGGTGTTGLNTAAASTYALSHALQNSSNQCAQYVRKALAAGGLTSLNSSHPGEAYQYGSTLTGLGFKQLYSGTYSASVEGAIPGLQVGDVVVFQPIGTHKSGHIAIYTSSGWVSDYKQSTMSSNPADYTGGAFAIYGP